MTTTEEARLIESRHEHWHVWTSDAGKVWATRAGADVLGGSGVSLEAPGMARVEQLIAAFDFAMAHQWDPWAAVAELERASRAGQSAMAVA